MRYAFSGRRELCSFSEEVAILSSHGAQHAYLFFLVRIYLFLMCAGLASSQVINLSVCFQLVQLGIDSFQGFSY